MAWRRQLYAVIAAAALLSLLANDVLLSLLTVGTSTNEVVRERASTNESASTNEVVRLGCRLQVLPGFARPYRKCCLGRLLYRIGIENSLEYSVHSACSEGYSRM